MHVSVFEIICALITDEVTITFKQALQVRIQRGGAGGPDPPGKLQVIWVSIGIKQLDPLEKIGPPWKMLDPL